MVNRRKKQPNYKRYRIFSKIGVAIIGIVSAFVFANDFSPFSGQQPATDTVEYTAPVTTKSGTQPKHLDMATAADALSPKSPVIGKRLRNIGYTSYFSEEYGIPVWVSYVTCFPFKYDSSERPDKFIQDFRVRSPEHTDYSRSGYDRGHMAPNYAISRTYGAKAQMETFYTTNIAPQVPKLNRKQWMQLEQYIANDLATQYGQVLVYVGPVISGDMKTIRGKIAIPKAFWMVVMVRDSDGNAHVAGFLIPQVPNKRSFKDYAMTVDQVEEATGLDFFPILNQATQQKLESAIDRRVFLLN